MLTRGLQQETAAFLVFFLWLVKSLENWSIIDLFITLKYLPSFFNTLYDLRSWQLYPLELLEH